MLIHENLGTIYSVGNGRVLFSFSNVYVDLKNVSFINDITNYNDTKRCYDIHDLNVEKITIYKHKDKNPTIVFNNCKIYSFALESDGTVDISFSTNE